MHDSYRLVVARANVTGPVQQITHHGDDRLDVRDRVTHVTMQVRVREISPYRHVLFLDGREFRVLNVLRAA